MRPEVEENPVTADPAVPAVGQLDVDGPGRGETGLAHDQLGPAGPVAVQVHPAQALHHRPLPVLDPLHAGRRVAVTPGTGFGARRRVVPQRLAVEHREHAGIGAVVLLHRLSLAGHEGSAGAAVVLGNFGGEGC